MSPKNKGRNTQSKSLGRQPSEELCLTSPNSNNTSQETGASPKVLSPDPVSRLPGKQRHDRRETASSSESPSSDNITTANMSNLNESQTPGKAIIEGKGSHPDKQTQLATHEVSNNRETPNQDASPPNDDPPPQPLSGATPSDPWFETFQELKAMGLRMNALEGTLDSIKSSTELHTQQMSGVTLTERTSKLESAMESQAQQMSGVKEKTTNLELALDSAKAHTKELNEEVSSLKTIVHNQGETIENLKQMKEEVSGSTDRAVAEMNNLIQIQRDQVNQFHDTALKFQKDISEDVNSKINEVKSEVKYDSLKYKSASNQNNLVITGLKEETDTPPLKAASDFFTSTLKAGNIDIDDAYRLGAPQQKAPPIFDLWWLNLRGMLIERRYGIKEWTLQRRTGTTRSRSAQTFPKG